jgi:plasmid maintenance system antidote protein VapI
LTTAESRVILHNVRSVGDVLRRTIQQSGHPLLTIEQSTGVHRASISRFLRGQCFLRSDAVDRLAAYFGLELRPVARRRKGR